jgi:peptidoglycan hydrolase-like protein with peptidoglycan-binding domain
MGAALLAMPPRPAVAAGYGCEEDHRTLRLDNPYLRGSDVLEIQEQLAEMGFNPGPADGIYGPKTAAAVRSLQIRVGLQPDGILGVLTRLAMIQEDSRQVADTDETPAPSAEMSIMIDVSEQKLILLLNGYPYRSYPVAVGRDKTPSPVGHWKILTKRRNWGSGFGSRWMQLSIPWGVYGIHGTNKPWSIGTRASAGCIRMYNKDVEELYTLVSLGTPVSVYGAPALTGEALVNGSRGSGVLVLQERLAELGLYRGPIDGIFDYEIETIIKDYQKANGLIVTGQGDGPTFQRLRLLGR